MSEETHLDPKDVFAAFVVMAEAGRDIDFEQWVKQHPGAESELRRLYEAWEAAGPLRAKLEESASTTPLLFRRHTTEPKQSAPGSSPGKVIGDFRLVSLIGRGGMGQVWEAEQEGLGGRKVAVKFVHPDRVTPRHLELFQREARAGGRLSHPGLVGVHAYGESNGLAWIAMELVEGGWTLRDFIDDMARQAAKPEDYDRRLAACVAEIADAMQAAHDAGVIHRDLKPRNVLIGSDEKPRVTDFGLARITDESAISKTGDFAGTYYYMSPEQVAAKRAGLDHRTDIFSLGVVLYELLTLRRPFEGDTHHQIAHQILVKDPQAPRTIRSRVPRDLAVICEKCLEKDRDRRYATMAQVAADIRRHLRSEPIRARPPSPVARLLRAAKRRPALATGLIIGALAGVLFVVFQEANQRVLAAERERALLEESNAKRELAISVLHRAELAGNTMASADVLAGVSEAFGRVRANLASNDTDKELLDAAASLMFVHRGPEIPKTAYLDRQGWTGEIFVGHAGGIGPSVFVVPDPVVVVDGRAIEPDRPSLYCAYSGRTVFDHEMRRHPDLSVCFSTRDPETGDPGVRRPGPCGVDYVIPQLEPGAHTVAIRMRARLYAGLPDQIRVEAKITADRLVDAAENLGLGVQVLGREPQWEEHLCFGAPFEEIDATPIWAGSIEFGPYDFYVLEEAALVPVSSAETGEAIRKVLDLVQVEVALVEGVLLEGFGDGERMARIKAVIDVHRGFVQPAAVCGTLAVRVKSPLNVVEPEKRSLELTVPFCFWVGQGLPTDDPDIGIGGYDWWQVSTLSDGDGRRAEIWGPWIELEDPQLWTPLIDSEQAGYVSVRSSRASEHLLREISTSNVTYWVGTIDYAVPVKVTTQDAWRVPQHIRPSDR